MTAVPAQQRRDPSFERLYQEYAADVYRYALALLRNAADAEDATQTTFLNAYRAYEQGAQPYSPRNWLITIAHNVCRMLWRQAGHRPREVALDDAPEPIAPEHDQPGVEEVLEALGQLPFNQRSALVMRELEGRSCSEIAETLGLSVSAVEALLFRARRTLRIQRRALGAIGTVPLPANLGWGLGLGAGGTTAGGAAIGADVLLKAATLFAVGAVTAGAVAVAGPMRHHTPAGPPVAQSAAGVPMFRPAARPAHRGKPTGHVRTARNRVRPTHRSHHPRRVSGTLPSDNAGTAEPAQQPSGSAGTSSLPQLPVQPPSLPQLPVRPPSLPQVPVQPPALPQVPVPPVPPLPIALPPPPPLPVP